MSNELVRRDDPDLMTLGDILVRSGFFRDATEHAKAVVKVLAGREFGLGPIASMSGIHVVEGKPTLSAHLMAVGIKRSGRYDYRVREHTDSACAVEFFEVVDGKRESLGVSRYTIEDAVRADVARKAVWQKYPRPMLFARALSEGYRTFCPDALGLMGPTYVEGEIECEQTEPLTVRALGSTPSGSDSGARGAVPVAESVRPVETTVSTAAPSASTHPRWAKSDKAELRRRVSALPGSRSQAAILKSLDTLSDERLDDAEAWVTKTEAEVARIAAQKPTTVSEQRAAAQPTAPPSEDLSPEASPSGASLGGPSQPDVAPPGQFDPDLVSELEGPDSDHAVSRIVHRANVEQVEEKLRASLSLNTKRLDALEQPVKPKRGRKSAALASKLEEAGDL